jgi:hypothetical protein
LPARSSDILCDFLGQCSTPMTKAASRKGSAGSVANATSTLLATARAVLAACPAPVAKAAAPTPAPRIGPRHIERAPATAPAEPGSVQAVFQDAVREVPEPDGTSSLAAAFDGARAKREDGRYGTPITGGSKS